MIAIFIQPVHLYRIKKKNKVKVCFLVSENQKWNCDSLYHQLKEKSKFDVSIVLSKLDRDGDAAYLKNLKFFLDNGYEVNEGYNLIKHTYNSLKSYDLIFYQQPWNFSGLHKPEVTFMHSLLCYIPYGLMVANNDKSHYGIRFQKLLWKYFSPNIIISELFFGYNIMDKMLTNILGKEKVVTLGHPKLDYYIEKNIPVVVKPTVIYAPHHSIDDWSTLKYATFEWSGIKALELAEKDPMINWVFKPHPRLKQALKENNIMTDKEVDDYYLAWDMLPNAITFDSGDYLDIFLNSSLLLTDCGSFLAEYLPTTKPVILLVNKDSAGYNVFGDLLVSTYYKCYDGIEMESIVQDILYNKIDPMKKLRVQCLNAHFNLDKCAGLSIAQYLIKEVK